MTESAEVTEVTDLSPESHGDVSGMFYDMS